MIGCHLTDLAEETLADAPIIVISGAREVSKSTLMEQLIAGRDARIINLDNAVDRTVAERDPDAFIAQHPSKDYSLSHFRDNHGSEVDIILEDRRRESRRRRSEGDVQSTRHRLSWAGVSA